MHPHINDDDNQNFPDLDDGNHGRQISAEIITMDEDDTDNGPEGSGDSTNDHREVEITKEEYCKLMGINHSMSSIGMIQTPSPPMGPSINQNHSSSASKDNKFNTPGLISNVNSNKTNANRRGFMSPSDSLSSPNTNYIYVSNSKLDLPSTIGIATGAVSPNTVEAVHRATKHHEEMSEFPKKSYAYSRKTKVPTIELNAKKLPRHRTNRTMSADSPNTSMYNPHTRKQYENPLSLTARTKSTGSGTAKGKKRKILLSKARENMNDVKNMNNMTRNKSDPMNGNSHRSKTKKTGKNKTKRGKNKISMRDASPKPFNKHNVSISPPSQSSYGRYSREASPSPHASLYDISSYSDKPKNRLPPKKLYNEVNTDDQRKPNYANLRNRRLAARDSNNSNSSNNSSRATSNSAAMFRRTKKKPQKKRKSFKLGQEYVEEY